MYYRRMGYHNVTVFAVTDVKDMEMLWFAHPVDGVFTEDGEIHLVEHVGMAAGD